MRILLLLLALAGCSTVGGIVSPFDTFDGRWVADLPPHPGTCCPSRFVLDVDGHRFTGTAADCTGTRGLAGRVDDNGNAVFKLAALIGTAHFAGENFSAEVPGACPVPINGSRGG